MLPALFALARRVWADRADVRARFVDVEGLDYWIWFMSEASADYPELDELVPLPPATLVDRVVGYDATGVFFRSSGLSDACYMFERFEEGGLEMAGADTILDFGCGCGRLIRYFARFADTCRLVGVDPDRLAIEWCRAHLDFATFEVTAAKPPTLFADGLFDGVYALSVFSHLPEALHRAWLEELHRITRPGGTVVLTTQGRYCADEFLASTAPSDMPTAEQLRGDLPELEDRGYLYYSYDFEIESLPAIAAREELYGMTFILPEYVRTHWTDLFELVALHEAPKKWQDFVVLRRR